MQRLRGAAQPRANTTALCAVQPNANSAASRRYSVPRQHGSLAALLSPPRQIRQLQHLGIASKYFSHAKPYVRAHRQHLPVLLKPCSRKIVARPGVLSCYAFIMAILLSHISAIEFWLSQRESRPKFVRAPVPEKGPSARERKRFRQRFANQLSTPVHTLVQAPWPNKDAFQFHSCRTLSKDISFATVREDVFVCPVELAFVQVASDLAFLELVRLGFELCGTYSIDRRATGGFFQRETPTTPQRMLQFLNGNPSLKGAEKARRALRYVAGNAASPAEARLAMSLTLPLMYGGLGLPKAQLNYSLPLGTYAQRATGRHYFLCDMFWPESNVAVEYDSDLAHTGSQRIAHDSARRNALSYIDVNVITVTRAEYQSRDDFNRVARIVAKRLGRRIRIRDVRFNERQIHLRKMLASQPAWETLRYERPLQEHSLAQ